MSELPGGQYRPFSNEDTLAVDLIYEQGPGRDYMASEHTVQYMRDEIAEELTRQYPHIRGFEET